MLYGYAVQEKVIFRTKKIVAFTITDFRNKKRAIHTRAPPVGWLIINVYGDEEAWINTKHVGHEYFSHALILFIDALIFLITISVL